MRRAVILATLTFLLFAVAGVTAAREDTFTSSAQAGDQTESTAPEPTELEPAAPEVTVPEDPEKPDERMVEATVVVPEEPKEPGAGNNGGVKVESGIEEAGEPAARSGKPEHAQGGKKYGMLRETGKPEHPGKPPVRGKPDDLGEAGRSEPVVAWARSSSVTRVG